MGSPLFWPGGEVISRFFGRRVGQLALPMRPLDVARGMDSRVVVIADGDGRQRAAAWLRTLRSTGEYVYSGCYGYRLLPGADRPSVHVAFRWSWATSRCSCGHTPIPTGHCV